MSVARWYPDRDVVAIGTRDLLELKSSAASAQLRRARLCLHSSEDDVVHQMVIGVWEDSYVRPHRHPGKIESFHIVEGRLSIVIFDTAGRITNVTVLEAGGDTCIYTLRKPLWHTVVPLSEYVAVHEITNGPFRKGEAEEAPWSPETGDRGGVRSFLATIRATACVTHREGSQNH
jgi:cupin fold WbuC family metalloprotein